MKILNLKINQMENTLENKAKFFAQYWGQKVYKHQTWSNIDLKSDVNPSNIINCANGWLEIKPLSSITDFELGAMARFYEPSARNVYIDNDQLTFDYYEGDETHSAAVELDSGYCLDYLRSKGYATEWMNLSVEQLEEYGWIKIKK